MECFNQSYISCKNFVSNDVYKLSTIKTKINLEDILVTIKTDTVDS